MEILFQNRKLQKIFDSEKKLRQEYAELAVKIMSRRDFLEAAENLAQVPVEPPLRRHMLKGQHKNKFAVDLNQNYRLVFEPYHIPIPVLPDGGFDLKSITNNNNTWS